MRLEDSEKKGWLTKHKTSLREIADLLAVADRDLSQCQTPGLAADWRLNIAYNAALQVAIAALAAQGYRPSREAHHYRAIQSLTVTMRVDTSLVRRFHEFRKKRNLGLYERAGIVSDQEAKEMVELARLLREKVKVWLRENHPELSGE